MSDFPTEFSQHTKPVMADGLNKAAKEALQELADKGYQVRYGLTDEYANNIAKMALEPSIKEYCPNDCGERFASLGATESWLAKGRVAFLLLQSKSNKLELVGYGWAGAGTSLHVPDGETTFALRIGEVGQGQGLATPFARLIINSSAAMYDAKNFWLETWHSNGGAVHIYHKLGFENVDETADERLTADGGKVPDTRLYMSLPNNLLNTG